MTRPQAKRVRKARRKRKEQWGVFFPMWNKKYAETLLVSFQRGNGIPHSMRPIAELRKLLPVKRAGARV